jgi:hypothetical protein
MCFCLLFTSLRATSKSSRRVGGRNHIFQTFLKTLLDVVVETTMVAFLRLFLLCSSLLTAIHSFHTIARHEKRVFRLFSIRNDVEYAQSSSSTTEKAAEQAPFSVSRSIFLCHMIAATSAVITLPSYKVSALEGRETGVELFGSTAPIQNNQGIISAEIRVNETPVKISFQTPLDWPLLATPATNQGLEARASRNPDDSAFVQVVSGISKLPSNGKEFRPILLQSVLSQQGNFGACNDVHVRAIKGDPSLYSVTFTTLTPPGQIEVERQVLVKVVPIRAANSLVLLVVGTTRLRYPEQKEVLQRVVDSFEAVPAL